MTPSLALLCAVIARFAVGAEPDGLAIEVRLDDRLLGGMVETDGCGDPRRSGLTLPVALVVFFVVALPFAVDVVVDGLTTETDSDDEVDG